MTSNLNAEALRDYDRVFAELAPVEAWATGQRNVTFHYPELVPAKYDANADVIANALIAAADETSSATLADRLSELRFDFADAVVVHTLGFKLPEQSDEFAELVRALRDAHYALGLFVLRAVAAYFESLPPGTVSEI